MAAFDAEERMHWFAEHRATVFGICAAYLAALKFVQAKMASRDALVLKYPMAVWNGALALFSIIGSGRLLPELIQTLLNSGFASSVCSKASFYEGVTGYWVWLFLVSKVFELGDSFFVVLRKRKLIMLQWYHHALTLINVWLTYPYSPAIGRWTITTNYLIHAMMYSYFCARTVGLSLSGVGRAITTMQISQFVVLLTVTIAALYRKFSLEDCDGSKRILIFALVMLASYLVLFVDFFRNAYIKKSKKAEIE